MKISVFTAAAGLIVGLTNIAGCSSCAKDDSAPAAAAPASDQPATPLTNQKASPLPYGFQRREVPAIGSPVTTAPTTLAVSDAGPDATTH